MNTYNQNDFTTIQRGQDAHQKVLPFFQPNIDASSPIAAPPARSRIGADPEVSRTRTAFHLALAQDRPDLAKPLLHEFFQALEDFQRRKKSIDRGLWEQDSAAAVSDSSALPIIQAPIDDRNDKTPRPIQDALIDNLGLPANTGVK